MSKVQIGKGIEVSKQQENKMQQKPGGSNVGQYQNVTAKNFAGPAGGAPKGTFPINTMERAKSALSYAHNAPNPQGIRNAVEKKYPSLDPKKGQKK